MFCVFLKCCSIKSISKAVFLIRQVDKNEVINRQISQYRRMCLCCVNRLTNDRFFNRCTWNISNLQCPVYSYILFYQCFVSVNFYMNYAFFLLFLIILTNFRWTLFHVNYHILVNEIMFKNYKQTYHIVTCEHKYV